VSSYFVAVNNTAACLTCESLYPRSVLLVSEQGCM